MRAGRLPVAPRPFRDETLSSWLGRIACRYGLDASALAACLAVPDDPFEAPRSAIDDISPSADQIALWARAAAVDPARLRRMTLAERHPRRPPAWFLNRGLAATRPVTPRPSSPVCLACFDADRGAGRDGYCRASWRLPERCVCPAHGRMLIDQCPNCRGRLGVAFRLRENHARPVCAHCARALEGRGGEGEEFLRDMATALLTMQARIAAAVDHAPLDRTRLEEIVGALWSPLDDPGASRPVLTLWVSERGWRAPVEARLAVGQPMPFGLLPVPVRALTLVALRDLFGEEVMALERGAGASRLAISARRASASRLPKVASPAGALAGRGVALACRLSPSSA
jgi:TniQ